MDSLPKKRFDEQRGAKGRYTSLKVQKDRKWMVDKDPLAEPKKKFSQALSTYLQVSDERQRGVDVERISEYPGFQYLNSKILAICIHLHRDLGMGYDAFQRNMDLINSTEVSKAVDEILRGESGAATAVPGVKATIFRYFNWLQKHESG